MDEKEEYLTIGLVHDNHPRSAALEEMISHLGLDYELVSDNGKKYPLVISDSLTGFESARKHVASDRGVIIAEKVCDTKLVCSLLSGTREQNMDAIEPVVNIEENKLMIAIRNSFREMGLPLVYKPLWPNGCNICVVLTHDIDWLSYSPLHRAVLKGNIGIKHILSLIAENLLAKKDFGWNIPELIELEKSYNSKSTYFFKTRYHKNSELLPGSIELVKKSGSEVALHASDNSHVSEEALGHQLAYLERVSGNRINGVRHHILKINSPETWRIEVSKNLSYDATFAYNRYFGFRAGSCLPYHPIDVTRLPLIELPTSFMDWTALHRNIRHERLARTIERQFDVIGKFGGVMVVNFHNTYMNRRTFPDVVSAYEYFLGKATSANSWVATASECVDWWIARENVSLRPALNRDGTIEVNSDIITPLVESNRRFQVNVVQDGRS